MTQSISEPSTIEPFLSMRKKSGKSTLTSSFGVAENGGRLTAMKMRNIVISVRRAMIVAMAAPCFEPFASVLPLFFPRITIYYLQITGKYKPLAPAGPSVDVSVEDDPEPAPEPEAAPRDEGGET